MAYNFKSIADVEVVAEPSESANVLIEENGVIKKAPKTAVGGAGGEADLVIRINNHPIAVTVNNAADNIEIVSGSVEAVYDTFESGLIPKVEVEVIAPPSKDSYYRAAYKLYPQIVFYGDFLYINFVAGVMFGEAPQAVRIVFKSSDNYALSNYVVKRITTTT